MFIDCFRCHNNNSCSLSSSKIYKKEIDSYSEKIVSGSNAQHDQLTENQEIIDYIVHKFY
ncbi:alpha/beta hydrolase [Lactococcus cremoris]|uniref:Alpha/beta hydrolase n=1 Tax=Lactococcus lactis subsp. cremoris TaxID=1359 RepID=A0AAJ6N1U3_LACLC|nr:alpha/beta hydrolase [Lactococcus cremoris]WKF24887.1 alpha/beta hydrolase [Lactococcus cremoris]WKT05170.1 alpha/beta hydrolase [Lactococcus cremoris]WOW92791.1 alpha/beta hydrolase [Lactococcus cremoris]